MIGTRTANVLVELNRAIAPSSGWTIEILFTGDLHNCGTAFTRSYNMNGAAIAENKRGITLQAIVPLSVMGRKP